MSNLRYARVRAANDSLLLWDHMAGVFTYSLKLLIAGVLLGLAAIVAALEWIYRASEPERSTSKVLEILPAKIEFLRSHHGNKTEARS